MSEVSEIISVSITVSQDTIARTSFGIPAIHAQFATNKTTTTFGRARTYSSVKAAEEDGWVAADGVHKALTRIFAQDPKPASAVVGRRDSGDSGWPAAFATIMEENNEWYAFDIVPVAVGDADISLELEAVSAWAEDYTRRKLFFTQHSDAEIANQSSTTDIGAAWKTAKRKRSILIHRPVARLGEQLPLGWFAEGAAYTVGASSYSYKDILGTTTDKFTATARAALEAKNVNYYTTVANLDVMRKGVVSSGEWIDVIQGIDWLTAGIEEDVFAGIVAERKFPYDDPGIVSMAGIVQARLEQGGRNGILQLGSIAMTVPKYDEIPLLDRQSRKITGVGFKALLRGSAYSASFVGTVSV